MASHPDSKSQTETFVINEEEMTKLPPLQLSAADAFALREILKNLWSSSSFQQLTGLQYLNSFVV